MNTEVVVVIGAGGIGMAIAHRHPACRFERYRASLTY
jgi:saccharopine dehydrogenase-like NADP-dependent oxidoreductase